MSEEDEKSHRFQGTRGPYGVQQKPPIIRTRQILPFEKLSPLDFERLCLWLVRREGYPETRHIGAAGQDFGRDLRSDHRHGEVLFQCKRRQSFGPKLAAEAVREILVKAQPPPAKIILIVACNVTQKSEDAAKEASGAIPCEIWALTEIDERAKRHEEILLEFFDQGRSKTKVIGSPTSRTNFGEIWLEHVMRQHRSLMPYFETRGAPLLESIYVEIQLSSQFPFSGAEQANGKGPTDLLGQPMSIRDVLSIDPAKQPWATGRWMLKGDPGSGKTTLLRHLALKLAQEGGEPYIPIYESLPRLMRDSRWMLDRIEDDLRCTGHPAEDIRLFLESQGNEGRLLFLLDGLDEVAQEFRTRAHTFLADLSERWPTCPLIITSRPIGALSPGREFLELDVLPFDEKQRRAFLNHWFGGEKTTGAGRAARAAAALESDRSLRDLASNPLYLTLMAILIEEGSEPSRYRALLFDQILDLLEEGRHHSPPTPIDNREAAHDGLRFLAWQMTEENRDSTSAAGLENHLWQKESLRDSLRYTWPSLRRFLDDLAEKTGILGAHDGPDADWRFWHRTFRETLAAEGLQQLRTRLGEAAVLKHVQEISRDGQESRWAEPYALLAGKIKDPDLLVKTLAQVNPALGLRALASAQGLKETTLGEILNLSADWKQRVQVYQRIPELLDDPERALLLLNQLRLRTTNGNDLYFIDLALLEVSRKAPACAPRAQTIRKCLYDHIPPIQLDLFNSIPSVIRDLGNLWQEIPAGKSLLGSTRLYPSSGDLPQREVTIESPFRMAAVPVTNFQYRHFDSSYEIFKWPDVEAGVLPYYPVVRISWYEAVSFCRWLSSALPQFQGARLPTSDEWEHAARGGTKTLYWSGDSESSLRAVGFYEANSSRRPHSYGHHGPNPFGLFEVHGGIWEWTSTPFDPVANDSMDQHETRRVMRGGSCWDDAEKCTSASRLEGAPDIQFETRGFRIVLPHADT